MWDSADIDCRLRRPADLAAANLMSSSCATALYSRSGIVAVGKHHSPPAAPNARFRKRGSRGGCVADEDVQLQRCTAEVARIEPNVRITGAGARPHPLRKPAATGTS